jgi:branched-chain amino acid transport system substrate-binding protein
MKNRIWNRTLAAGLVLAAGCAPAIVEERPPEPRPPVREEPPPPPPAVARVGVILPRSGSETMRQYAELVLQGIQLGLPTGSAVELVVVDDGGDAASAARVLGQLEQQGVVAVIGPMMTESMIRAGQARTSGDLVIISPTASDIPIRLPNVYSLNTSDLEGARALARHAASSGLRRVAMLYPGNPDFRANAVAFRDALHAAGGEIAADIGYREGTTTFAEHMRTIATSGAQAVYVAATERDLRQIAPQIEYYGLGDIRVLGNEAWASDEVLRGLPARQTEGVTVVTPLLPTSRDVAWGEFVGRYEAAHRRTLDNPYPALGYDAARLILDALEGVRPQPREVAQRLAATRDYRGATGIITVRDGALVRRPFLARIENSRLVPIRSND